MVTNKYLTIAILIFNIFNLNSKYNSGYQPVIINGKEVAKGKRICKERYAAIKPILDQYKRPFTVLDLGAAQGYFSINIVSEYDATSVMMDKSENNVLFDICKKNTLVNNRLILLDQYLSLNELKELIKVEHFDVVLALNVLHHTANDWKEFTDLILQLGDNVIIENPVVLGEAFETPHHTAKKLQQYLLNFDNVVLGQYPRYWQKNVWPYGIMRWYKNNKKTSLTNAFFNQSLVKNLDNLVDLNNYNYRIFSNFENKTVTCNNAKIELPSGIGLCTYKFLSGIWPTPRALAKKIENFAYPWNIKLNGTNVTLTNKEDVTEGDIKSLKQFIVANNTNKAKKELRDLVKNS